MFETLRSASWLRLQPGNTIASTILIICALTLGGCIDIGSSNNSTISGASPTPASTPVSSTTDRSVRSSVLPIRDRDAPDQLLGSAVIISEDGFLLTSIDVIDSSMEVLLPNGRTHRPALVSTDQSLGLAMLKIPETDLVKIEPSTERPGDGTEVFANGYDGAPDEPGRINGSITGTTQPEENGDYRVRGTQIYDTDMNLISGFVGGALTDHDGNFCGILVSGSSSNGDATFQAVSQWYVIAWMEDRERRMSDLREQAETWETTHLPGEWTISHPEDWGTAVQSDSENRYRAELAPADPDVPLQLAISVEENEFGTDPAAFADDVFSGRDSARIWSIGEIEGRSLVRATISQEGALVDVAYLLDEEFLIAISLTSGYQPDADHAQVDQARALFETVVQSLESSQ